MKDRSRAGAYIYLTSKPTLLHICEDSMLPPHNAAIHIVCKVMDTFMSSAQEAETTAGFLTKKVVPLWNMIEELGHAQGPTPLQFDNTCAYGIINNKVKQKIPKAMDVHFY